MLSSTEIVAQMTEKAAGGLKEAVHALPEDRRDWQPLDTGRSVLDQLAECAILNGYTARTLTHRAGVPAGFTMDGYLAEKAALTQDWEQVNALFDASTAAVVAAIRAFPESDYDQTVELPWGPMPLQQILTYPAWNLAYHEGQVRYIASLLRLGV